MTAYALKSNAISNVKGVRFRFILWDINKDVTATKLNNSVLDDKGILWMDFGANKTPVEIISKDVFEGTYLETFVPLLI